MKTRSRPALLGSLLAAGLAFHGAHAAEWKMQALDSRLEFSATFEKTPAPGQFRRFDVQLDLEPARPEAGHLDVSIDIASADMSSADINKAIAGNEWFDFSRFARAEFHANEIRRTQPNAFVARGTLKLKGVQQAVEVPFSWSESGDAATMEGSFVLKRGTFGIGTGEWAATNVIGADVTVAFKVRLRKAA